MTNTALKWVITPCTFNSKRRRLRGLLCYLYKAIKLLTNLDCDSVCGPRAAGTPLEIRTSRPISPGRNPHSGRPRSTAFACTRTLFPSRFRLNTKLTAMIFFVWVSFVHGFIAEPIRIFTHFPLISR